MGARVAKTGVAADRPAKGPHLATAFEETRVLKSPKFESEAENKVIMGELRHPPTPTSLHPKHEG